MTVAAIRFFCKGRYDLLREVFATESMQDFRGQIGVAQPAELLNLFCIKSWPALWLIKSTITGEPLQSDIGKTKFWRFSPGTDVMHGLFLKISQRILTLWLDEIGQLASRITTLIRILLPQTA